MTATMPGPVPRAALDDVPAYVPKPPKRAGDGPVYRVFLNENPYPPLPSVINVIATAAGGVNRYPDVVPTELARHVSARLDVPESAVVCGPGSVGVYQQIGQAMLAPGDRVLYAWPSFEAYPIVTRTADATPVVVPLDASERHDLPSMACRLTEHTRVVFLCNPNNPTGTAVRRDAVEEFLDRVPPSVLVVIDEAYREFVRDPLVPDGIELWRRHRNVVVLRTFSKAYGLAGLRVGYAVAHHPVAEALRKCAVPCGVGSVAIRAAIASLSFEDELFERVERIVAERERIYRALATARVPVTRTETNFLWLPYGPRADAVAGSLVAHGVLARLFPGEGIRLTIGSTDANDAAVHVLVDDTT